MLWTDRNNVMDGSQENRCTKASSPQCDHTMKHEHFKLILMLCRSRSNTFLRPKEQTSSNTQLGNKLFKLTTKAAKFR